MENNGKHDECMAIMAKFYKPACPLLLYSGAGMWPGAARFRFGCGCFRGHGRCVLGWVWLRHRRGRRTGGWGLVGRLCPPRVCHCPIITGLVTPFDCIYCSFTAHSIYSVSIPMCAHFVLQIPTTLMPYMVHPFICLPLHPQHKRTCPALQMPPLLTPCMVRGVRRTVCCVNWVRRCAAILHSAAWNLCGPRWGEACQRVLCLCLCLLSLSE